MIGTGHNTRIVVLYLGLEVMPEIIGYVGRIRRRRLEAATVCELTFGAETFVIHRWTIEIMIRRFPFCNQRF
jgi:hypothetical protein